MNKYFYDLHIHSCLSPCADDDMTPANIAGMAAVQGLTLVALTDHNSCKNCPAFFAHAKRYGIVPVAGMELTTAEDIHVICLFPDLESAMRFDSIVSDRLIKVKNKAAIFGNQFIMDENDEKIGEEENLLINATSIDLEEAFYTVRSLGGVCYPAHIDRESGGLIAVLGDFPEEPTYTAFELNFGNALEEYRSRFHVIGSKHFVVSSDAHNLWSISEAENSLDLDDEPYSSAKVRRELIRYLRGES
ncbi:MAG: PHP domain-containing protein [Clostridia bacterium]|nr:PHP domain-containing protein [Clostridia bacterium]